MTDPTRDEVDRDYQEVPRKLTEIDLRLMASGHLQIGGSQQELCQMVFALRERAEAAEADAAEWQRQALYHNKKHGEVITASRRAEAAAWNDAIKAAAEWHQSEIARLKEQVSENNAYLARVGAASYDSDANRYCIDQISAHEQSVAAIRVLRRAAPTEGEA